MRALTFTVPKEWEQSKLKVFLRGYCNLSARLLTKQKRVKMGLTINGEHGRANDLLKTGDVVCVNLPDIEKDIEAVPLPLDVYKRQTTICAEESLPTIKYLERIWLCLQAMHCRRLHLK